MSSTSPNPDKTLVDPKPHKCKLCDHSFGFSGQLMKHFMFAHSKENLYKCKTCKEVFSYASYLSAHERAHERAYRKPKKRKQTHRKKGESLCKTRTLNPCSIRTYRCRLCDLNFPQFSHLILHKQQHHDGIVVPNIIVGNGPVEDVRFQDALLINPIDNKSIRERLYLNQPTFIIIKPVNTAAMLVRIFNVGMKQALVPAIGKDLIAILKRNQEAGEMETSIVRSTKREFKRGTNQLIILSIAAILTERYGKGDKIYIDIQSPQ